MGSKAGVPCQRRYTPNDAPGLESTFWYAAPMRPLSVVVLATFLLACDSEPTPEPTIAPVVTTQHIDLWELDLSLRQVSLTVTEGNTVGLTVDVVAETDSQDGGRCAEPTVIDPFGNVLAKLSRDLVEVEEGIDLGVCIPPPPPDLDCGEILPSQLHCVAAGPASV